MHVHSSIVTYLVCGGHVLAGCTQFTIIALDESYRSKHKRCPMEYEPSPKQELHLRAGPSVFGKDAMNTRWILSEPSLRPGGGTPRGKMEWDHFKVWKHIHRIFKRNPKCCLTVEWKRKPLWGTFAKLHTRCVSALLTNARACKLLSTVGRAGRTSHAFFFALCWHLIAFTPTSFSH